MRNLRNDKKGYEYMRFQELAEKRYSCRNFSQRKVEKELVDKIIKAGITAPTAVNTQPVKIFWLKLGESKKKISGRYATIPLGQILFLLSVTKKLRVGFARLTSGILQILMLVLLQHT